ncbi:MAG: flagellar hook-basal body complex protein [Rhodanobacter sp.]
MDAFIYTAMSGADHAQRALQVRANNLANAQTGGFRADMAVAETAVVPGYGYDSRHQAMLGSNAVDHNPGQMTETGRALDVAIHGTGYFMVDSEDGPAYTRAGSFVSQRAFGIADAIVAQMLPANMRTSDTGDTESTDTTPPSLHAPLNG